MRLVTSFQPEPMLEFGEGEADTPKRGLAAAGPYTLRLGAAHPARVRVGLAGPPDAMASMRRLLDRCLGLIESGSTNRDLAPDYPGFEQVFRCELARDDRWDAPIDPDALGAALAEPPAAAFQRCLDLWAAAISTQAARDLRPDVIICCLPAEVLDRCRRVENRRLSLGEQRWLRRRELERQTGQLSLLDLLGQETVEGAVEPAAEDMLFRDFRRSLKLAAMSARVPIQIATPHVWEEGRRDQQDAATRAWNLTVGLFYKSGGIPWRVPVGQDESCFVGISFHHLRTTRRHVVYSSLAQAFSTAGDGFALRGDAAPWSEDDRIPHLTGDQAKELVGRVLFAYRERAGRDPLRVVVHKTSRFRREEAEGIRDGLCEVPSVELMTLRSGEFRVVRQGTYPPHRGSLFRIGDASYLFTAGFMPQHRTYPGPHVPVPIEIAPEGRADVERAAADIMALTKMNWNSAASYSALPITLGFARRVGAIMSEVPQGQEPHPSFRFYM
jgi:hypothetical protein